jgi:hypothetical protein
VTTAFLTSNLFYPAASDPEFAGHCLDAGYLTTVPGTRAGAFYSLRDDDPAVIAKDEEQKDVVAGPELMTGSRGDLHDHPGDPGSQVLGHEGV